MFNNGVNLNLARQRAYDPRTRNKIKEQQIAEIPPGYVNKTTIEKLRERDIGNSVISRMPYTAQRLLKKNYASKQLKTFENNTNFEGNLTENKKESIKNFIRNIQKSILIPNKPQYIKNLLTINSKTKIINSYYLKDIPYLQNDRNMAIFKKIILYLFSKVPGIDIVPTISLHQQFKNHLIRLGHIERERRELFGNSLYLVDRNRRTPYEFKELHYGTLRPFFNFIMNNRIVYKYFKPNLTKRTGLGKTANRIKNNWEHQKANKNAKRKLVSNGIWFHPNPKKTKQFSKETENSAILGKNLRY